MRCFLRYPLFYLGLLGGFLAPPCLGETKVPEINRLINADFESDLSGWNTEGAVRVESKTPLEGKGSLSIGPGKGAVRQRYRVAGLQVILFSARLKVDSPTCGAQIRVQCYDAQNHLLMDLKAALEPGKEKNLEGSKGIYFKTQARTTSLVVSIEKTTDSGVLYADTAELKDNDRDRKVKATLCNLEQYMVPFWHSPTIYNETVLLYSKAGELPQGKLLFTPEHIVSVYDYSLRRTYRPEQDYTLAGNTLTATANSSLPSLRSTDIPQTPFPWVELPAKQIVVTYTHRDTWNGPIPAFQGTVMPRTLHKLTHRQPLVIVATGDSITLGTGTSSNDQIPPYMPTWGELFVQRLRKLYSHKEIQFYNTALGGMTSQWGLENADSAVATLNPDLVIIAYGMNDFWWMPPDVFQKNIQGIIDRVHVRRPDAEFVLVSSMRFDPAYTEEAPYRENLLGYARAIHSLTGPGVCELDMTAITDTLFARKEPKGALHDPLHPNDYLARWYAQGLVALFDSTSANRLHPKAK